MAKLGLMNWIAKNIISKIVGSGLKQFNIVDKILSKFKINVPAANLASYWNQAEQRVQAIKEMQTAPLDPSLMFKQNVIEDFKRNIPYRVTYIVNRRNPVTGEIEMGTASRYFQNLPTQEEAINELMEYEKAGYWNQRGEIVEASIYYLSTNARIL